MKSISTIAIALLLLSVFDLSAQAKFPAASSTQNIVQGLGISEVAIKYQRPNALGRNIFGGLVPYNKVWRTGANEATVITLNSDVKIAGNQVPAGIYALFSIPSEKEWTIILNKEVRQWGAYQYKETEDILRFKVKPVHEDEKVETFTISFDNVTPGSLDLCLSWENVKVSFPIVADQSEEIMSSIENAMKTDEKPYLRAAQYYYNNNLDIQKAAHWINEADKGNTKAAHIKYWKSKILLKAGDKAGAANAAREGIEMAKSANNEEYVRLNTEALAETE